jgi:hypothetical protein
MSAEVESELAAQRYADRITSLAHLKPQTFHLTDGALKAADEFRAIVYELESEHAVLGRGFCAWAGKLAGTYGSLSLLLHMLENREEAPFIQIGENTVRNVAVILSGFLIPHARAFYQDTIGGGNDEALQTVASYILTSDQDRFTLSDFRYNARPMRGAKSPWEINALLAPFVSGGWLAEDDKGKAWTVTEGLRERFADRRAEETGRKAKIMSRFKPNGGDHEAPL